MSIVWMQMDGYGPPQPAYEQQSDQDRHPPPGSNIEVDGRSVMVETADRPYAFSLGPGGRRYEIHAGDSSIVDAGANKNRAEIEIKDKLPVGRPITISYDFRISPESSTLPAAYQIIGQLHQTPDPGEGGAPPEFSLQIHGHILVCDVRTGTRKPVGDVQAQHIGFAEVTYGQWYHVQINYREGAGGPGSLRVRLDGDPVCVYDGPLGFPERVGPFWKEGAYAANVKSDWKTPLPPDWRFAIRYRNLQISD